MQKFVPLPLAKRNAPKDAAAAAALTLTVKAIATAPSMKTKTACVEFWEALSAYVNRNIAELGGAKSRPAVAKNSAKPRATAKAAEKTMTVGA